MTRRLGELALGLYPLAFRRRYGDEMRALLEESPPRPAAVLDLVRGALAAHLRPPASLDGALDASDRLRASESGVLACWVLFAAAGFGFYKTTENIPTRIARHPHSPLGGAHAAIQTLALAGSLAIVAGALPLIVAALGQARRERNLRLRVLVSLPIAAVGVFAGLTGLLVWFARSQHGSDPTTGGRLAFVAWLAAGLACGAVCVVSSRKALFATPVASSRLVWAFGAGALATATMVAMTLVTGLYAIVLALDLPGAAGAQNGPMGGVSTIVSLGGQLAVMSGAGALAMISILRGRRGLGASEARRA
jgi:hypothetical protein